MGEEGLKQWFRLQRQVKIDRETEEGERLLIVRVAKWNFYEEPAGYSDHGQAETIFESLSKLFENNDLIAFNRTLVSPPTISQQRQN